MKYSKQHALIHSYVTGSRAHPTADEIYLNLKQQNQKLSLGTVYRNLNRLVNDKKIMRLLVPGSSDRYDHNDFSHSHLVCSHCCKIFDIKLDILHKAEDIIKEQTGFEADDISLTVSGSCNDCLKKRKLK